MTESEEELKSLLMKVKEESEKVVLKLNIFFHLFLLVEANYFTTLQWVLSYIDIKKLKKKKSSTFRKLKSWHPVLSLHGR